MSLPPVTRTDSAPESLIEFSFETVTVDARGAIVARSTRQARQLVEDLGGGLRLEMVAIPGGSFAMGCHGVSDVMAVNMARRAMIHSLGRQEFDDERPQHAVRLAPFLLGKYPVTQEQWAAIMVRRPPYRCRGDRRPVERVSWREAVEFCHSLTRHTGRPYGLPSEAQWEYACRAGTVTAFCFGPTLTTDLANYVGEHTFLDEPKGVYRHGTTDVGSFPANAFGLHDMPGNVWEWCADAWHADYTGAPTDGNPWARGETGRRVVRGGCWHDPPSLLRSAARLSFAEAEGEDFVGLRVMLPRS
jgi:formylglycine-generating enzyme required for sulfatase activity